MHGPLMTLMKTTFKNKKVDFRFGAETALRAGPFSYTSAVFYSPDKNTRHRGNPTAARA